LGQDPIPEFTTLRGPAAMSSFPPQTISSSGYQKAYTAQSSHYELCVSLNLTETSVAGLTLRKSPTSCEETTIYVDVANEAIFVDRSMSSLYYQFNNMTEEGKFRLWHVNGELQSLDLHIFVDNSIVEIFANGIFCMTTRIYPTADDANDLGYWVKEGTVEYSEMMIWDGLDKAWPERPENSSVPLVWDSAAITDNGTLWTGN
jgi:beta-fructofuranosidase